jgi:UDP-N-acetylmuramate--alanine ligase
LVADIYAAGEAPIEGADKAGLVAGLRDHGHKAAAGLDGPDKLAVEIAARTSSGDVVMCLGAGDITAWASALPHELDKLAGESA